MRALLLAPFAIAVACSKPAPPFDGTVTADEDGFHPEEVPLAKGQAATIHFKRVSDRTCATEVVFPDLKLEKKLPLNQSVDVEIPAGDARTLTFQCGMGMFKGKVVVK